MLVCALAGAPSALAGSVGSDPNGNVHFTASPSEVNDVTITKTTNGYMINDDQNTITSGSCSQQQDPNTFECFGSVLRVFLGDGNDVLVLGNDANAEMVTGGAGQDDITGSPQDDEIHGDEDGVPGSHDTIDGGGGADLILGQDGNDMLRGEDGNDSIEGGDGNDVIEGGSGNDGLDGNAGDDYASAADQPGGDGADGFTGGAGIDTFEYFSSTPVNASLDDQANDGRPGEGDNVHSDVEVLKGGAAGDNLTGSPGANTLNGQGGPDVLEGGGGDDILMGGALDPGADVLDGGDGNDAMDGGPGNDALSGGDGNDALGGGDGNDIFSGGPGADGFGGGLGTDRINYAGIDAPLVVTMDGQPDDGQAGEGDNVGTDVEGLAGGERRNTFEGNDAGNTLDGGPKADYIDGASGADMLTGGAAGDTIRSRDGEADVVQCGDGPDFAIADEQDTVGSDCELADDGSVRRPRRGQTIVVLPAATTAQAGTLGVPQSVKVPAIKRFVPLQDRLLVPVRTKLDATLGAVRVRTARTRRRTQTARFKGSRFVVRQSRRAVLTRMSLRGGDFGSCPQARRSGGEASTARHRRRVVRRLRGRTRGRFRTRGRHSSATVRGTRWVVKDRCDGTLTRVFKGRVVVRDFAKNRTVRLGPGDRYLARPRARRR